MSALPLARRPPVTELVLRVDSNLGFHFQGLPPRLLEPIARFLAYFERPAEAGDRPPLKVTGAAPRGTAGSEQMLVAQPPLEVWAVGERLEFRLPGLLAWQLTEGEVYRSRREKAPSGRPSP